MLCKIMLFVFNYSSCGFNFLSLADPYLNTDAGTMSPFEHGEVFVLDDGGEVNRLLCLFFNGHGMQVTCFSEIFID